MLGAILSRFAVLAVTLLATPAIGQTFPGKPIRLLLTFSGGQADVLARVVTEKMTPTLGQPVVIEHRPGGGGNIAMEAVARAAPDGHTLVLGSLAVAINGTLYRKLSYDPVKDLVPISLIAWGPYALYVSGAVPMKNAAEVIARARSKPGELNYASVGVGSGAHLVAVLFMMATGAEMSHIPYKGIQQITPDLISGQVQLTFNAIGPLTQFVQSGKVRLLALTGPKRLSQYPDIPTLSESGLPGFEAAGWYGVFAPAGTPRDVLVRLNSEVVTALNSRDVAERIEKLGLQPSPQTLEEAGRFVAREVETWSKAVRVSGATAE